MTIAYEPRCNEVYIPNVFSPNGDGRNDLFRPWSSFFIKDLGMVVYNRYGQVLYKGEGNNMGWNGMYKGVAQDPAAYVYLVVYTDHFGVRQTKKGNVILLR